MALLHVHVTVYRPNMCLRLGKDNQFMLREAHTKLTIHMHVESHVHVHMHVCSYACKVSCDQLTVNSHHN